MWQRLGFALAVSFCAAVAVHYSFGPAFVDNVVGYLATAYVCGLVAVISRPPGSGWATRGVVRAILGLVLGLLVLTQLRGWAMFSLPWGEHATSGHSPFGALPISVAVVFFLLEVLARSSARFRTADAA